MKVIGFVTGLALASTLTAQVSLSTTIVSANVVAGTLPTGPLQLPYTANNIYPNLHVSQLSPVTLRMDVVGLSIFPFPAGTFYTDLQTVASTVLPARVDVTCSVSLMQSQGFNTIGGHLDIGDDGSHEVTFSSSQLTTVTALVDSRGTAIGWYGQVQQTYTTPTNALGTCRYDLTVQHPQQAQAFGAPCGGELGVQRETSHLFRRVFVASFPDTCNFAALIVGFQQQTTALPGFTCQLLVSPDIAAPVPLVSGPNNRKFVDFDVMLPALFSQTYHVQAAALDPVTVYTTNGVQVQT